MITLYVFGPAFGLPEGSPFVIKTEVQLRMAGLAYRKDATGFERAPKGKLPYIDDDGVIVPDSTFIRDHIERTYGVDLDAGLTARERAESWAIERLIEDHLGWASSYFRWIVPENFAAGPAHLFDHAPEAIRDNLRREVQAKIAERLYGQGMGRHSPEEIASLGIRSLWSLAAILGDKPFLMGERPTAVDATAFGMLANLVAPVFRSPLRQAVEDSGNLSAYTVRMMRRFYPEFAWTGCEAARPSRPPPPRHPAAVELELAPLG